jgi:hypothetical protein
MEWTPSTGLLPDPPDERDFRFEGFGSSVLGVDDIDWDKGFNAYEALKLSPITQDQGTSQSCVAQATKSYMRRVLHGVASLSSELSARFVYAQIHLPNGGAYIRDGVSTAATKGNLREVEMSSYDNGNPPSEGFMRTAIIDETILNVAKKLDKFSYRMIPGDTGNIDVFAQAIKNFHGAVGGFTGTNEGWCRSVVRPPKTGETKWGHAVDLCGFGKLDVDVDGMKAGTKCLFTKNSWGDRYAIQMGKWKGYQAIPEEYFTVSQITAVGLATGIHVFNSWVLVPDEALSPSQKTMDFIKRNEGKIIQDSEQSGAFGIIVNGEVLVAKKERVPELIATYLVRKEGVGVPAVMWNELPKKEL